MERHGMRRSSEYRSWSEMKQRCLNPKNQAYKYYGDRGISVYEPWIESFSAFYEYMGPKPYPEYSIDRIDVDGNYEPGNVRWANDKTQVANRRVTRRYDFHGHRLMAFEIDAHIGCRRGVIDKLLNRGYMLEEIVEDIVFDIRRLYKPTGQSFERLYLDWDGKRWGVQEIADHFGVSYSRVYSLLKRHRDSSTEYMISILSGERRDRYDRVRVGDVFRRLTVIEDVTAPGQPKKWLVRCSCGTSEPFVVHQSNLASGHTKSCGCLRFARD